MYCCDMFVITVEYTLHKSQREGVIPIEFRRKDHGPATKNSPLQSGETTTFIVGIYLRRTRLWYAVSHRSGLRHVLRFERSLWSPGSPAGCICRPAQTCALEPEYSYESTWHAKGLARIFEYQSCRAVQ